jgi:hypothetical protein
MEEGLKGVGIHAPMEREEGEGEGHHSEGGVESIVRQRREREVCSGESPTPLREREAK